jgi:alcohol dehydrogenase
MTMTDIRAAQVSGPGAAFDLVKIDLPEPGPSQVRVAVEASGICHSDAVVVGGYIPGTTFPLVAGHEVAGRVEAVGDGVTTWQVGDRVGVGWFGGCCERCVSCREGDFINCADLQIPGLAYPGGFAEAMVVPANALARIPDEISAVDAAPMMCAGATTYNALSASNAQPADVVAVLGLGGVGHMGVQYAARMGYDTVSIARGPEKQELARQLGARHYIDSNAQDVAAELRALGGARVVLATAADSASMAGCVDGLAARGQLVIIGASAEPLNINPLQLIFGSHSVVGHASGTSRQSERALAFAALTGVRPMVETAPLEDIGAAFARMLSGDARFRMVLTTNG